VSVVAQRRESVREKPAASSEGRDLHAGGWADRLRSENGHGRTAERIVDDVSRKLGTEGE